MTLPAANQPISFQDINEELGRSSTAQLDLEYASEQFGLSRPHGMDELAGRTFNTFTFDTAQVTEWGVSTTGVITPPTLGGPGTITSITYVGSISNTSYAQVSSDTTRTANIIVQAPATGYGNNNALVSGSKTTIQGALQTYTISTWVANGGVISINGQTGAVSLTNSGDSTTTPTFTPTSFSTFTSPSSQDRNVTVGNIGVPAGYYNSGNTISGTVTVTQLAYVQPEFTLSDWTGNISISGQTGEISATVGNVSSVNIDTSTFSTVSSSTNRTVQFDLIGIPSGYSNTGGNLNNQTKSVTQPAYVTPPDISFTTTPSTWSATQTDARTLTVTNDGGPLTNGAQFAMTGNGLFKLVGVDSNVPVINPYGNYYQATATNKSASTFSVAIQPLDTNENSSDNTATVSFYGSNDGDSSTITFEARQLYPVTWNTNLSSLSFPAAGDTLTVVLNSSVSWTAAVSGTGYSINTTSGGSGTHNISVTKTASDLGGNGSVTFSASGQSDIPVTLSQAAAPLEWYYYVNGNSTGETTTSRSLGTLSYLGESVSIGLYAYRGSTSVSTPFNLQKGNAVSGYGVGTTTSNTSSTFTSVVNTGQNTGNSATTLYINASSNSGNSSTRTINVELYIDGTSEVTFTATQAADPNAGSGGGGTPPREPIE